MASEWPLRQARNLGVPGGGGGSGGSGGSGGGGGLFWLVLIVDIKM